MRNGKKETGNMAERKPQGRRSDSAKKTYVTPKLVEYGGLDDLRKVGEARIRRIIFRRQ